MASLLDLVQETITPEVARTVSGLVGETPAATASALHRAAATVLAAILHKASTTAGAERVQSLVIEGGWGADVLDNLGRRLAGGSRTGNLLSSGARLVSSLLGNKSEDITDLIARGSGVQRGSASTLLTLTAPIVMSTIGTQIVSRQLSASGLATVLAGERASLVSTLPAGINRILGLEDQDVRGVDAEVSAIGAVPSAFLRWWPTLLVGLAAVAMLFMLARGRPADVASTRAEAPAASPRQTADITLPGGARVGVGQGGSVHELSTFLAGSTTSQPRRFVLDELHFESGSTGLTPEGRRTVNSLLAVLRAYPTVQIVLEGHTDATGDAAANKALSRQRAEAVAQIMTTGGIAAGRLKAEGYGWERPLADNNTEAGRARNRRLEMVVVPR
jgi:outer membrane protein OmpA-like peptidoglycan-associated protein